MDFQSNRNRSSKTLGLIQSQITFDKTSIVGLVIWMVCILYSSLKSAQKVSEVTMPDVEKPGTFYRSIIFLFAAQKSYACHRLLAQHTSIRKWHFGRACGCTCVPHFFLLFFSIKTTGINRTIRRTRFVKTHHS